MLSTNTWCYNRKIPLFKQPPHITRHNYIHVLPELHHKHHFFLGGGHSTGREITDILLSKVNQNTFFHKTPKNPSPNPTSTEEGYTPPKTLQVLNLRDFCWGLKVGSQDETRKLSTRVRSRKSGGRSLLEAKSFWHLWNIILSIICRYNVLGVHIWPF